MVIIKLLKKLSNKILSLLILVSFTSHLFVLHPLTDNTVLCKIDGQVKLEKSGLNNLCGEHNSNEFAELSIIKNKDCEDTNLYDHNDDYQTAVKKRYVNIPDSDIFNYYLSDTQKNLSIYTNEKFSNKSNLALLIKSTASLLI